MNEGDMDPCAAGAPEVVAGWLVLLRQARGDLTATELSRRCGLTATALAAIFAGHAVPRESNFDRVVAALVPWGSPEAGELRDAYDNRFQRP